MKKKPPWPTKDGRPATREEIADFVSKVEAHYLQEPFPTTPHFCRGCTAPLEVEPCPVCKPHELARAERAKKFLE